MRITTLTNHIVSCLFSKPDFEVMYLKELERNEELLEKIDSLKKFNFYLKGLLILSLICIFILFLYILF